MEAIAQKRVENHYHSDKNEHIRLLEKNLEINDTLAHLYQYMEKGEDSIIGITEEIMTDVAERVSGEIFINFVGFESTGRDFISLKDKISMKSMTKNNLDFFEVESAINPSLLNEYERAKLEVQEVEKLTDWHKYAKTGSYLIFESLPLGEKQKFAISRIYQKTNDNTVEGCFLPLHNPSIDQFNEFRKKMNVDTPNCKNALEMLQNCYEFSDHRLTNVNKFVDYYTGMYDKLLYEKEGKQFSFGLENKDGKTKGNILNKIRNYPELTSVYLETIKMLARGKGKATTELIEINKKFRKDHPLEKNQIISIDQARDILKKVRTGIVESINEMDNNDLAKLKTNSDGGTRAAYDVVSHYSEQATANGEVHASGGCGEFSRSTQNEASDSSTSEYNSMLMAFGSGEKLSNLGKLKIDACRIPNCPSRGDIAWWPDKTLVGGCNICMCCHKLFGKNKDPERIYAEEKKRKEEEKRRIAKIALAKEEKEKETNKKSNSKIFKLSGLKAKEQLKIAA